MGQTLKVSHWMRFEFYQVPPLAKDLQVDPREAISYETGLMKKFSSF